MCVENKMTNNGPLWVPHGLKFQYRTHICPIWAPCPDSDHACWAYLIHDIFIALNFWVRLMDGAGGGGSMIRTYLFVVIFCLFDVVVLFHLLAIADKIYGNHCASWSVEILIKYAFS